MKHWFCDRGVCWFYDESESFGVGWDESGKVSHNSQGREVAEVRHLQGPHKWRQPLGTEPEINTVPARFRRTQFRGKALGEVWKASAFSNRMSVCLFLFPIFSGQERFTWMTRVYYRDAKGCIIMFDLTNRKSFLNITRWKNDLDSKVWLPDGSKIPCLLLANKVNR